MSFARQRSGRSIETRRGRVSEAELLETRQVLSHALPSYLNPWLPTDLPVSNPVTHQRILLDASTLYNPLDVNSPIMDNAGKIVSGTDRAGDRWVITVHGPGEVIVTDTTPNDGVLGDDINTIQLVGTSLTKTYVTGQVFASGTNHTSGDILFNQLIDTSGVKSIILDGFVLTRNVSPPVDTPTGIFLYGGVKVLTFQAIQGQTDLNGPSAPIPIMIGNSTTPVTVEPSIYIGQISNFVYDSANPGFPFTTTPPTTPLTTPNVEFIVNGVIQNFDIVAASRGVLPTSVIGPLPDAAGFIQFTSGTVDKVHGNFQLTSSLPIGVTPRFDASAAGYEYENPIVGTTGRTSVQATAIKNVHVRGSAVNTTFSRSATPFTNGSGLAYLKKAEFGGNADALGIDVAGKIGKLVFKRGLGNPNGVYTATAGTNLGGGVTGQLLPATTYGTPEPATGYPAQGYLGGQITARSIKSLRVNSPNVLVTTPQNPQFVQLKLQGWPTYASTPGDALTNAVITTSQSIGHVGIVGSQLNTEIKTGFDYSSYVQGLEGTRGSSHVRALRQRGDLISSIDSATVRPENNHYQHSTGIYGPGKIGLHRNGTAYNTGGVTGLGNTGAGVFARRVFDVKVAGNPPRRGSKLGLFKP
jgi:hypothetical protein